MPTALLFLGATLLAMIWLGPLPRLAQHSFAAHMTMHMGVVAVAAPLIALALTGSMAGRVLETQRLAAPIAASLVELVIVWGWHAPALHLAARHHPWALVAEQGSFLLAGLALWVTALGSDPHGGRARAGPGVAALLFTSMHMTLLGALFALANRPLFQHATDQPGALADQHVGGAVMLIIGGTSYLIGGLALTFRLVRVDVPALTLRRVQGHPGVRRGMSGRKRVEG